ncbi:MAG: TRAP transporter small permease subunit [Halobacteriovoraceae bacterium]|nr:TRAP transporter small permease subunit [Halobacteriovoraceae bacterium]
MRYLQKIDGLIDNISGKILVCVVLGMLFLSVLAIVLRWLQINIMGLESLVRHLVFLSAFLGGVVATGRKSHIAIDILAKYLEKKNMVAWQRVVGMVVNLATTLTLLWLVKASYTFCVIEWKYAKEAFFGLHSGFLVAIIPVGFSLIAFRFFYLFVKSCKGDTVG